MHLIKFVVEFLLTLTCQAMLVGATDVFAEQKVQTRLSKEAHAATKSGIVEHGAADLNVGVVDAFGRQVLHETRGGFLCAFDTTLRETALDVVDDVEFD